MCGRYTLTTPVEILEEEFGLEAVLQLGPRYNIAPTQEVAVVPNRVRRVMRPCRWGLIPSWARDASRPMINARAETLAQKRSFSKAFRLRRCLVLADGFYEWRKDGKARTPFHIRMRDGRPFAFAGIWTLWRPPDGEPIPTCAIVTVAPNDLLRPIHDRMPAILPHEAHAPWLDPTLEDTEVLQPLLAPYRAEAMEAYPVSKAVNSARHDAPDCLERVEAT